MFWALHVSSHTADFVLLAFDPIQLRKWVQSTHVSWAYRDMSRRCEWGFDFPLLTAHLILKSAFVVPITHAVAANLPPPHFFYILWLPSAPAGCIIVMRWLKIFLCGFFLFKEMLSHGIVTVLANKLAVEKPGLHPKDSLPWGGESHLLSWNWHMLILPLKTLRGFVCSPGCHISSFSFANDPSLSVTHSSYSQNKLTMCL